MIISSLWPLSSTIPKNINTWWSPWSRIITRKNPHQNSFKNVLQLSVKSWQKRINTNLSHPRNLTLYFGKIVSTDCCDPNETLGDTKACISDTTELRSKLIGVKLRKSPRNISYSKFLPGSIKLFNMHRGVKKLKLFSVRIGFTGQIFIGEVSGVDQPEYWDRVFQIAYTNQYCHVHLTSWYFQMETLNHISKFKKKARVFLQIAVIISIQMRCKYCPRYPNLEKQTSKQKSKSKLTILGITVSDSNGIITSKKFSDKPYYWSHYNKFVFTRQQDNLLVRKLASNYLNLS